MRVAMVMAAFAIGAQYDPRQVALVYATRGDGLVTIHPQRLAGIQQLGISARQQSVLHFHLAVFHFDQRGFIVVVDGDVEGGAAHRNHRGRREHAIRIGHAAEVLDVNADAAHQDVEEVLPVGRVLAEHHAGVRKYLKSTAVGNLQQRVAVGSGQDQVANLHGIADGKRPRLGVLEDRNLPGLRDDFRRVITCVKRK